MVVHVRSAQYAWSHDIADSSQIVLFRFLQSRNRFVRILKVARTSTELWVPRRVSMFEYQDFVFRAPVLDFIPRVLHRLFIKLASSAECQQFLVPQLH